MPDEQLAGQAAPGVTTESATTAAAQTTAATTSTQTAGVEGGEGEKAQVPATKTFTQQEVDELVKREKAKTESRTERRVMRTVERMLGQQQPRTAPQQTSQQQPSEDGKPTRKEGETDDAYLERLTDWKLEQREHKAAAQREEQRLRDLGKKTNDLYAKAEKLGDDFDRDAFDELVTKSIAEALVESEDAARLMHYLGSNVEEMQRIAQLSPARQAAELGKLEVRLDAEAKAAEEAAKPKQPQRSSAPQALAPAKGAGASPGMPDPSDTKAYIRWANEQERAARQ